MEQNKDIAPASPAALTVPEFQELALFIASLRGAVNRGEQMTVVDNAAELLRRVSDLLAAQPAEPAATFQARVQPWMLECFGAEIAADQQRRRDHQRIARRR